MKNGLSQPTGKPTFVEEKGPGSHSAQVADAEKGTGPLKGDC